MKLFLKEDFLNDETNIQKLKKEENKYLKNINQMINDCENKQIQKEANIHFEFFFNCFKFFFFVWFLLLL